MQTNPEKFPSVIRGALGAIVSLRATVPEDAFTAETLGTERAGYGVIIRPTGLVLTVGYLTAEAETIWVTTADGQAFPGHVLSYDFETGFGLVQILARVGLASITLGNSASAKIGDKVIVAGTGDGSQTVVARIIARQEFAGYWEYALDDAIFTAPAHPRWGGTAVIDLDGELIGIGSLLVHSGGADAQGREINMVIPIDILKPRLEGLLKTGRPKTEPRPWLGLFATEISENVVIMDVASRGPAANSRLTQGDVVIAVDGGKIDNLGDFFRRVWALGPAGVDVPLLVYRDGDTIEINIRSADRHAYLKTPSTH